MNRLARDAPRHQPRQPGREHGDVRDVNHHVHREPAGAYQCEGERTESGQAGQREQEDRPPPDATTTGHLGLTVRAKGAGDTHPWQNPTVSIEPVSTMIANAATPATAAVVLARKCC